MACREGADGIGGNLQCGSSALQLTCTSTIEPPLIGLIVL